MRSRVTRELVINLNSKTIEGHRQARVRADREHEFDELRRVAPVAGR